MNYSADWSVLAILRRIDACLRKDRGVPLTPRWTPSSMGAHRFCGYEFNAAADRGRQDVLPASGL